MASSALIDELSCSICLDLYTEPVSLKCGHNFCQGCIVTALDTQEGSGVYICPECREEYVERPTPEKNRKLCNIVENYRSSKPKEEKNEIFCTYCVKSQRRAVKTCVQCETSMCDKHLTAHNRTVDHVLMEPTSSFRSKKCSTHKKLLEYFCSEDATCLCVSCCLLGKHKGHKVELLEDACEKKKEKLRGVVEQLTMKRKATEQEIQNLQDHKRKVQKKEDDEKKRVIAMFEDFRGQLEVQEPKVLREISRQVEEVSLSVIDHTKQLEIQKDEVSRKMCHIEKICKMTDPITVLQDQASNNDVLQNQESDNDVQQDEESDSDEVLQDEESDAGDQNVEESSVGDLDDFMISLVLHRSITALIANLQLKSNFYVQDSLKLLLDGKTAHPFVSLSDDLRTASYSESPCTPHLSPESSSAQHQCDTLSNASECCRAHRVRKSRSRLADDWGRISKHHFLFSKAATQALPVAWLGARHDSGFKQESAAVPVCTGPQTNYRKLPERFTDRPQVMSRESFSNGRHYWEVEVSDCGDRAVGVCYPSIKRDGVKSSIGCNDKSWSFFMAENEYEARHDSESVEVNLESSVRRLGLYLHYEAGRLSFYQLCDPIRHLHTFTTTFTEPLHAAFYVDKEGSWVKLASPVYSVKS